MSNATPAAASSLVPSLAVAINTQHVPGIRSKDYPIKPDNITTKDIKHILNTIWFQLRIGLLDAWTSSEGGMTPWDLGGVEEEWAQLITEMLLCIPYSGPGQTYLNNNKKDGVLFRAMQRESDPLYPIVAACQQLCTMAAITRGFCFDENKPVYFDASNASEGTVEKLNGNWFSSPEMLNVEDAFNKQKLYAGSVYAHNKPRHIAFVLRANKDQHRIQFFDTGAMCPSEFCQPEKPRPKVASQKQGGKDICGIYDYNWIDRVPPGKEYGGWGILPEPPNLEAAIQRMLTARPLGFARLVLRKRKDNSLIFATPLLFMYDRRNKIDNFSFARYLWSLRYMPGREHVVGTWQIYIPKNALLEQMLTSNRQTALSKMLNTIYSPKKVPVELKHGMNGNTNFACIAFLSTVCDKKEKSVTWKGQKGSIWEDIPDSFKQGLVAVVANRRDKRSNLPPDNNRDWCFPWNKPTGSVQLQENDIPCYFRGEWHETSNPT